jgi:hypothetical protein
VKEEYNTLCPHFFEVISGFPADRRHGHDLIHHFCERYAMKRVAVISLVGLTIWVAPLTRAAAPGKVITERDCTVEKAGATIPVASIGFPVSAVTLGAPEWHAEAGNVPAYCRVDGSMAPVDKSETAKPIKFAVVLPAAWSGRAMHMGGGGMNGSIPMLTSGGGPGQPGYLGQGFATYGSDSGHQNAGRGGPGGMPGMPVMGGTRGGQEAAAGRGGPGMGAARGGQDAGAARGPGMGAGPGGPGGPGMAQGRGGPGPGAGFQMPPPDPASSAWATNDEAISNLGFMQLKKTHDAAMVIIQRVYGERPKFNYFVGASQGGREALTVAQRFPADYDGVAAGVPIVSFSSLMLGPELIRIHEKPLANWITPAKAEAIKAEFMRQCDGLDGLVDGIMNNYMACRAIFDVKQGAPNRHPWASKRCPNNVDPNPQDTSAAACLTDGQISTLEMSYSRYVFATPLANGVKSFGMWLPGTDPGGTGMIAGMRYRGQEGAAADAPMHSHQGVLGVTGFLMRDVLANPLDYAEGGKYNARRIELSPILDSTNPDLSAFQKRGGKVIVMIGTNDTSASPGAQLDYFQSVLDKMGQPAVDSFARFFVLPQTDHGLRGNNYTLDGNGKAIPAKPIPSTIDRVALLIDWVENGKAPGRSVTVTAGDRALPMCSYPEFPKYKSGPAEAAASYGCSVK